MKPVSRSASVSLLGVLFLYGTVYGPSHRKGAVFMGVTDGDHLIAVQSNPILVEHDLDDPAFDLLLMGVYTQQGGGGTNLGTQFVGLPGPSSDELFLAVKPPIDDRADYDHWLSHDTLWARFRVLNRGTPHEVFDVAIFLRTLDTLDFEYQQGGAPCLLAVRGGVPTAPPDAPAPMEFTGFEWAAVPREGLVGRNNGADADIRFELPGDGAKALLTVESPPYDGAIPIWDVEAGLFDLLITSTAANPHDVCEHHFDGTDYANVSRPAAQPTLTLRPGGVSLRRILQFMVACVELGTIEGSGPGDSGPRRLRVLMGMIESADELLQAGKLPAARLRLHTAHQKCDGAPKPPDFVTGPACAELAEMIHNVMEAMN